MNRETIFARLKRILMDDFSRDETLVTPDATLGGTLMLDTLDLVDLVFFIEREFGVDARLDEYRSIRSLGGLVGFIEMHHRPLA
jgi:acyl carrier protein